MALFRRRKEPAEAAPTPTYGAYIWHQEDVLRVLLIGNEPFKIPGDEGFDQDHCLELLHELDQLVVPTAKEYERYARLYPSYIALSLIRQRHPDERLVDKACEILARVLGWNGMPILGEVHNFAEFSYLNEQHNGRWRLGSF